MRIKRLELHGFKSFKDKTAINFDAGITGIVGPNGCGKSNVVDAFFWALGEMNARNLRGQNMEDLIFNGSDHAPAANSAEVNLILDIPAELSGPNAPAGASFSDMALTPITREVAVTRRLYRNGESEYLINKVPCRLKDIQELFMDTGAGARGYSIIQQGKIAEIVNAKPDERRTMIEDVAGVVKYKSRRREAQRKLEATTQNLLRVSDILTEIDGRKKQMERQAEKARRYKEWKEELQTIELRHSSAQWEEIVEKLGSWDKELESLEIADAAISAERETADNYVQQKRLEATSAAKVSEEFQSRWIQQAQGLNTAESNLKYQRKVLEDLTQAIQAIDAETEQERTRIEELLASFSSAEREALTIEEAHAEAVNARDAAEQESRLSKQSLDGQERNADQSHQAVLENSANAARAQQKVFTAENRLRDLETKLGELESQRALEQAQVEGIFSENEIAALTASEAASALESTEAELSVVARAITDSRKAMEAARRELGEFERAEVRISASLRSLEEQKQRYEGSARGVQTIFQTLAPRNEAWKTDLHGTLASVLQVASGMEAAVETALGPALEIVLAGTGTTAIALAAALRDNAGGRASFADLSQIQADGAETAAIPGVASLLPSVSLAPNLANRSAIQNLLTILLANVFVAENLESARSLASIHGSQTFVTRAGEVCRGKWFVYGGDASQASGSLVARNREIEALREELGVHEEKISAAKIALAALEDQFLAHQTRQTELEEQRELRRREHSQASSHAAVLAAQTKQARTALDSIDRDLQRFSGEIEQLRGQETEARELVARLEAEGIAFNEIWQEQRASIPELRQSAESAQQRLMEARVAEASLLEQKNSVESSRRNAKTNLERAETRVENLLRQVLEKRTASENAAAVIEELEATISELRTSIVSAEADYRTARDSLDEINASLEEYRTKSENTVKREREIKDRIGTVKMSMERVLFERQNIAQNVMERYGIEIGEFVANPEIKDQLTILRAKGEAAQKELETDVLRLKEKIRKLGEVNTSAIEEYDELVTRFTFLAEQKADLEKSMADLQNTIDKINRISRERFFRAFNEVNKQFTQVFPALFGGGQAQLMLTSPDDFNETGVDIVAQPPGKKLQNINLLSGGEKTLTAISLLFAIFLVKPSPFCLLDEVDAPLDDANIGRFNALLREMAKQSQFIIITHNKRTMELNDKLYGVTMEDAGISKMVSIQLTG